MQLDIPITQSANNDVIVKQSMRKSNNYDYLITSYESGHSLLTDSSQTTVFAYLPPRQTQTKAEFQSAYVEGDLVEVLPALEGTLIGFFWNQDTGEWDVCTRNGVGCDYSFIRPMTFREMIMDALRVHYMLNENPCPEDESDLDEYMSNLNNVLLLNRLSKNCCYTCVLQHHKNHIVYTTSNYLAYLKLVGIYRIDSLEEEEKIRIFPVSKDSNEWIVAECVFQVNQTVADHISTLDELTDFQNERFTEYERLTQSGTIPLEIVSSDLSDTESLYYPPAWIMTNSRTGHTCEIPNPFYEEAKALRNLQPNLLFLFLDLLKKGLVERYITAFPKYHKQFSIFAGEYQAMIDGIYRVYVDFYILKKRDQIYPKQYFIHAAKLHHNVFLPSVGQTEKTVITHYIVCKYFWELSATKMYYYLTLRNDIKY